MIFIILALAAGAGIDGIALTRGPGSQPARQAFFPVLYTCPGKAVRQPSSYILSCANAQTLLTSLRWSAWAPAEAIATGQFSQDDCDPDCADGAFANIPVQVTLSELDHDTSSNLDYFTRLVITGSGGEFPAVYPLGLYGPGPVPPPETSASSPAAWAIVSAYYADVESHDYAGAWDLLSPAFQDTYEGGDYGNYQGWAAGYADTGTESLTETGQSGDTVDISLAAYDTATGLWQYYTGSYTVAGGLITSGTMTLTGQGQDE